MVEPTLPSVSVIVATIEPWPEVKPCLDRLLPQVAQRGAELILADGTPNGRGAPPPSAKEYDAVKTFAFADASVFSLRARGAERSIGEIVAFTEDHCIVDTHWLAMVVGAFSAHPEADMVAGATSNGSSDSLVDWANFLMTFAEFMPPAPRRPLKRTPPMNNASFRRSLLLAGGKPKDGDLPEGWLELVLAPTVVHSHRMHYDDAIVVSHVQPRSLRDAMAAHFNNGRACAGLVLPHIAPRDWRLRVATTPVLSWIMFVSVIRSLRGRAIPWRAWISLPVVALLSVSHAAGELVGLLRGEGGSARRLN